MGQRSQTKSKIVLTMTNEERIKKFNSWRWLVKINPAKYKIEVIRKGNEVRAALFSMEIGRAFSQDLFYSVVTEHPYRTRDWNILETLPPWSTEVGCNSF